MKKIIAAVACLFSILASSATGYSHYFDNLPFEMQPVVQPSIPDRRVDVSALGAKGDAITLNTDIFQHAIDSVASLGGGHIDVGNGVWLTGPLTLRSNIDIHLSRNAILVFSPDRSLYKVLPPDEGTVNKFVTAPLNADGEHDISITGEGIIDGNGEAWRPVKRMKVGDWEWNKLVKTGGTLSDDGSIWYPATADAEKGQKRPRLLRLVNCRRVMLTGVTFQNSPSFHVNMFKCEDILLDRLTVRCPWNAQNGDGIDLSSCRRALIVNCIVDCGDDAICLKSGVGDAGRARGITSDIVVDNCRVYHGHGGFVIGSDEAGGMRNISVTNCCFTDTDTGLRFKSGRDRGGLVEGVYVSDIVMNDIDGAAILFDMYYQEKVAFDSLGVVKPVTADTPRFRDFHISRVTCREAGTAVLMTGLPEMKLEAITIEHCSLSATRGILMKDVAGSTLSDITLQLPEGVNPVEQLSTDGITLSDITVCN